MKIPKHDAVFKKFLSNRKVTKEFLQLHLPPAIRDRCDFSTLTIRPGSFVEENLRQCFSDILYSMKMTMENGDTNECLIYFIIEHQSNPQKFMALRKLRYVVNVLQQCIEQGCKKLPVVVPILFYHGKVRPYPYSNDWLDCFADRELAESVYFNPFPVVDVTAIDDEEIMKHGNVALLELVQKHIFARDMMVISQAIVSLLNTYCTESELIKALMYYIAQRGEIANTQQFLKTIIEQAPTYREDIMTIAQDLRKEGREEGMQQGKKQAALEFAKKLLVDGASRDKIKQYTSLSDQDLDALLH